MSVFILEHEPFTEASTEILLVLSEVAEVIFIAQVLVFLYCHCIALLFL